MDSKKRRSQWPVWIAIGIVSLPAIYILGIGPAVYVDEHISIPWGADGWLALIYGPFVDWCERDEMRSRWLYSYLQLWTNLDGAPPVATPAPAP